jgi:23S rRNA pseudouridine1911/1915/1917 synthase
MITDPSQAKANQDQQFQHDGTKISTTGDDHRPVYVPPTESNGDRRPRLNQGWTYHNQVNPTAAGWTVLEFYTRHYRHSPPDLWQDRIAAGQVLLEGVPTTANTRLKSGQRLAYHRPPWQEPSVPLSISVLYEDADLLVVAKPAGLPVLPGGGFLEHTLLWQLQQRYPQDTPVPIHRLGRGTSGLMLLARSPLARSRLSQQMRDRQIDKRYRALAVGTSMPDQFSVTHPIGKVDYPGLGGLYAATAEGLSAQSDCRVLRRHLHTTLLEVTILTGRPHQIRIHLAAAGYPLVGDPLYGVGGLPRLRDPEQEAPVPLPGDCGYHLHAYELRFLHPTQGHALVFSCPPPPELT